MKKVLRSSLLLIFATALSQESNDYKYEGAPYYPEQKLEAADSLKWPLTFELGIDVKDIKYIDIDKDEFTARFMVNSFSKYDDSYVSKSSDTISLDWREWFAIYLKDDERSFLGNHNSYDKNEYSYLIPENRFRKDVYLVEAPFDLNWNFRKFPFDKQELKIGFTTLADTSIVKLVQSTFLESNISKSLAGIKDGYSVKKIKTESTYNIDESDQILISPDKFRGLVTQTLFFTITLDRSGSWLFFKLFTGGILSYIISCMIFLIPFKEFESKVTLGVGAIFGAIGNRYFVDSIMPNVQVFTKADAVSNLILIMVVFNLLVMILQNSDKQFLPYLQKTNYALFYSIYYFMVLLIAILLW